MTDFKKARQAYERIIDKWWGDEERHYCETYDVDAPENISTENLKSHDYKNLRVLEDYFNEQREKNDEQTRPF